MRLGFDVRVFVKDGDGVIVQDIEKRTPGHVQKLGPAPGGNAAKLVESDQEGTLG
jgi:hypothetical protein